MKILLLGKAHTHAQSREYDHLTQQIIAEIGPVRSVSANSRDGIALMQLYDVVQTPAYVVTRDDGTLVAVWQHRKPTLDEVSAAVRS
ncbi:hypothetical protein IT415_00935 [bacterium]|nr:hypothetical protein [bacterium]